MIFLPQVPFNPIRLLAPQPQREEAQWVAALVETMHPEPFRWSGQRSLTNAARELRKEADWAGDTATWMRAILRYLSVARSEGLRAEWPTTLGDFLFRYPSDWANANGQLTAGGVPVRDIETRAVGDLQRTVSGWMSVEGHADRAKNEWFWDTLPFYEPILWGLRDQHAWRDATGKEFTVKRVQGVPAATSRFERKPGQIALLRIGRWEDSASAVRECLDLVKRDGTLRLLLDLRQARGDDLTEAVRLFRSVATEPKPFAERITTRALEVPTTYVAASEMDAAFFRSQRFAVAKDGRLALKPLEEPDLLMPPDVTQSFRGRVDVLIGPGTGAIGAFLSARLRESRPVRLIGDTASGYGSGFCGGKFLVTTLPSSKIRIRIPLLRIEGQASENKLVSPQIRTKDAEGWAIAHPPTDAD